MTKDRYIALLEQFIFQDKGHTHADLMAFITNQLNQSKKPYRTRTLRKTG